MASSRLALTLLLCLVAAGLFLASGIAVRTYQQCALAERFDRALLERARDVAALLAARATASDAELRPVLEACGVRYQLLDAEGRIIGPQDEVAPLAVDLPAAEGKVTALAQGGAATPVRVATVALSSEPDGGRFLQLLESDVTLGASAAIDRFLATVVPASVLLLGTAAWWLAGRFLGARGATSATPAEPPAVSPRAEGSATRDVELQQLRTNLDAALASIEDGYRAQSRFVGNIAHELKTPLATAINHAELMQRASGDVAALERYAASIVADMQHLSAVVDGFLRLARANEEAQARHEPVYVHDVVLEGSRHAQPLASERGVTLVTTLSETTEEPLLVHGDRRLLETMVENLARHAIEVTPCGARIDLRVDMSDDGQDIVLRVRDQGPGVAPDHLASIFDWFFKTPGDRRLAGGTGLGLAIAKRVAEHHDGSIAAANHPDGTTGTEVRVQLPRMRSGTGLRGTAPAVRGRE